MHLVRQLSDIPSAPRAVAIGNFDGRHHGHRAVIQAMVAGAKEHRLIPSVLTFEPHPRRFFAPTIPSFRIERLRDKLAGLAALGVEQLVMPRFNAAFAQCSAEDFLEQVLRQRLGAKWVVTGEGFVFGHQRRGNGDMLKAWGKEHNITIVTVPPVAVDGHPCSSTRVRAALKLGDMHIAARLLGRPYTLSGRVVHGDGRGRTIGFPTANIALAPDLMLPAYEVYAVRVTMEDGRVLNGVANLGIRPTVAVDKRPSLEVHLFDTVQEIYGKRLTVSFVDTLRPEMKFDGVDALKTQIAKDCETARLVLGTSHV